MEFFGFSDIIVVLVAIDAPFHYIDEMLVFSILFWYSLAKIEWADGSKVLEPLAKIALVREIQRIGNLPNIHIGVG